MKHYCVFCVYSSDEYYLEKHFLCKEIAEKVCDSCNRFVTLYHGHWYCVRCLSDAEYEDVEHYKLEVTQPQIHNLRNSIMAIETALESMSVDIRDESAVYKAELADRLRKGLEGKEAIAHYNEWMRRYHMDYLMVKED